MASLVPAIVRRGLVRRLGVVGVLDLLFFVVGYTCMSGNVLSVVLRDATPAAMVVGVGVSILALIAGGVALARRGRAPLRVAREIFVLLVLVGWGLLLNHLLRSRCRISSCDAESEIFRPLAEPQVYGLLVVHLAATLAYAISRRRQGALPARVEALVHLGLLSGLVIQILLALQFGDLLPYAVMLPITFPVVAPLLSIWLFGRELALRLRRRGREAQGPGLARALASLPAAAGAYAVVQGLLWQRPGAALEVFTATCGHLLSRVPVEVIPQDCHYLCTVAAQGHPWLVRPQRLGRRRGRTIVVNRQLAVANAFEDLLHERWPRFGAWARRTYDRLGLPVSRLVRSRAVADLIYLAMKPLEWCFFVALLLCDPAAPEERIDRMYRP